MFIQIQHFRTIKPLVLIVFLIIFLHLFSCTLNTSRNFIPVETQQPVTMFGQYSTRITGDQNRNWNDIDIDADFINPIADTAYLETIPIFMIDSVCFEGDCMDSSICRKPVSDYQELLRTNRTDLINSLPAEDLRRFDKQLSPQSFYLKKVSWFPKKCSNKNLFVTIHARLLERFSGKTISEESKKVEYFVNKKTTLNAGS